MILTIEQRVLQDALASVTAITDRKTTLPILTHAHLSAEESQLVLIATDLEVGLRVKAPCSVEEEGVIAAPAKKLFEFVRGCSGPVRLEGMDSWWLRLQSGAFNVKLAGMDPADFPAWSALPNVEMVEVSSRRLGLMIDKTVFASSTDESRFNLNGVRFEATDEGLRVVATDGHRLAMMDEDLALKPKPKALIPKRSLQEIRKILDNAEDTVLAGFHEKNIIVESGGTTLTARLLDGDFPDYRKVVPEAGKETAVVERIPLIQALRRVQVLTSDRNRGITMTLKSGALDMTATHPDLGSASDSVIVDYEGQGYEIIINVNYLLEALSVVDTDSVTLEYTEDEKPIIVRPHPSSNYFSLVMPMYK
jgi:DNA polymerase-3 subunit beta